MSKFLREVADGFISMIAEVKADSCELYEDIRKNIRRKGELDNGGSNGEGLEGNNSGKQKRVGKELYITDYMPYDRYDESKGIYKNKKGYGFILKITPFSGLDMGGRAALESLINYEVPSSCFLEVINYASPKIGYIADMLENSNVAGEKYAELTSKRAEFIKSGSFKNILGNKGTHIFRDFEIFIAVSVLEQSREALLILMSFKERLAYSLKNLGSRVEEANDLVLGIFLREFLNPSKSPYIDAPLGKKDKIEDYLSDNADVVMEKDGVRVINHESKEEFKYITFEVVGYPSEWSMNDSNNFMEQYAKGVKLPFPFLIRQGMKLEEASKSKRMANRMRVMKIKQGDADGILRFVPKMIEEIKDWDYVNESLEAGDRLSKNVMSIVAVVVSGIEEKEVVQAVKSHFSELKFAIEQVRYDTVNSFISCLPFGFSGYWKAIEQLKIANTFTSGISKNLMPVFADHGSTVSSLMLLSGRRGQLFFFDNYLSRENFNIVVVGAPGKGKSTFLSEYTLSTLRLGGQVVTLDDGKSAKNLCRQLKGEHTEFTGAGFCINPFSFYMEEGDPNLGRIEDYKADFEVPFLAMIRSILCIIMEIDVTKKSPINAVYKVVMDNAVEKVMKEKGRDGGFYDIWSEIKRRQGSKECIGDEREAVRNLGIVLQKYATGDYKEHYNGCGAISLLNLYTVFEFKGLEEEALQNSVLMIVVFLVYSKMFKRERRMSLIIDEAWRLLGHNAMKEFIGGIARRARKYRGSLVVATQNYFDFSKEKSETAADVLASSDWRVMAGSDGGSYESLKNDFGMEEYHIATLKGVQSQKGLYSEYMIMHKNGSSDVARMFLDPFTLKLYSSTAEEVLAMEKLIESGLTIAEAIDTLIKEESIK